MKILFGSLKKYIFIDDISKNKTKKNSFQIRFILIFQHFCYFLLFLIKKSPKHPSTRKTSIINLDPLKINLLKIL